jgi:mediator of RNA polymerase II transcription subunit 8
MTKILAQYADLFQRVAVHPSSNFPGRTQEGLLPQLLRKKLEIPVEDWVNEGRATQATNESDKEKENDELWDWAKEYVGERVALYVMDINGKNYTREEREAGIENVRTGLRRKLPETSEEDEEDSDEEMEGLGVENTTVTAVNNEQVMFGMEGVKPGQKNPGGKARRLSDIMRYVTTGDPVRHYPSDRELEVASNKSMEFSHQRARRS